MEQGCFWLQEGVLIYEAIFVIHMVIFVIYKPILFTMWLSFTFLWLCCTTTL